MSEYVTTETKERYLLLHEYFFPEFINYLEHT